MATLGAHGHHLCNRLRWHDFVRRPEEVRRYAHPAITRQRLDGGPPAPRDAVHLPFVNGLAVLPLGADAAPNGGCNDCPATKFPYQGCMFVLAHGHTHIRNIFGSSRGQMAEEAFGEFPRPSRQDVRMVNKSERDPYAVEVGDRLRAIRKALGYERINRFAENTGTDEDNLSNWERGVSVVPQWYVQRLKELFGVTHDWIYGGDASTLRQDLSLALLTVDKRK